MATNEYCAFKGLEARPFLVAWSAHWKREMHSPVWTRYRPHILELVAFMPAGLQFPPSQVSAALIARGNETRSLTRFSYTEGEGSGRWPVFFSIVRDKCSNAFPWKKSVVSPSWKTMTPNSRGRVAGGRCLLRKQSFVFAAAAATLRIMLQINYTVVLFVSTEPRRKISSTCTLVKS